MAKVVRRPAEVVPATAAGLVRRGGPTPARLARAQRVEVAERIEGRPVVVFVERPRLLWGRTAARVAVVTAPIAGAVLVVVYVVTSALLWVVRNGLVILGVLAAVMAVLAAVRGLLAAGVCCPGLHCPGCGHR